MISFDTPADCTDCQSRHGAYYLELFHGPTIAFKDMAFINPYLILMVTAAKKNNCDRMRLLILTATSGDTGKGC